MQSTLAAQLAQLELGHLAIDHADQPVTTDLPETEAVEQTLGAIWSDLLALFPDTALEEDAEEIAWGLVNIFHRAAAKRSAELDRATDEIRVLLASADGSEVRDRVADMVLVQGGDTKGLDRIAAAWAERRKVAQVAFGLDRRLGSRAGFRRNEQMLSLNPRCLVAFGGNGVLERLVIQAKDKGIHVVDRRGPLGTNPKLAAREAEASA